MNDHHRHSDTVIETLETKLDKFIDESRAWRKKMETRFTPVEDFYRKINTPVRLISWCIVIIVSSVLVHIGAGIVKFVAHLKTQ